MDTVENPRATIGGNKPPIEELFQELNNDLPAMLARDCAALVERSDELEQNAKSVPNVLKNEAEEALATDIVSQMKKHMQVADARRLGINALPRKAADMINTFFKTKAIDKLEKECDRITPALTRFKREKAEKERREREERERLAREAAEAARREAEEAERKRREAEEAKRRAEQEAREAEERKRRAEEEARQAEERRKRAEQERIEAEARARAARDREEREAAERAAAAAKRAAEEEERAKREARERADREREALAAAKTDASLAKAELSDASKAAKTASSLAKQSENDVKRAEQAVGAKASELSGVRGDYGGHSSLTTRWVGEIVDRKKLNLEKLRDFFTDECLQKALNAFVKVHKGDQRIAGARIYEETTTTVR